MEQIYLIIEDDGVGFDKSGTMMGLGMSGMRERAEMNDGTFDLSSETDKGIKIEISIPVKIKKSET